MIRRTSIKSFLALTYPKTSPTHMPYTLLDRRFRLWHDDKASLEDHRLFERAFFGEADWAELLKHQRVIVLAEAGSGKSIELEMQSEALMATGQFAFHATVKNVAASGLVATIGKLAAARLADWQLGNQTAWFLIDSVDEAKLDHIRLRDALTRLANDIGTGMPRARIILSGRYSNWEFRTDLYELERCLPIAAVRPVLPEGSGHPLIRVMHKERKDRRQHVGPEKPLVVLMAPLDRVRVRAFASSLGVTEIDGFLAEVDTCNLWSLAERPLDLSWLVDYWRTHKRFGRFAEMLEASLRERLHETDVSRASREPIDTERAFHALERIGATLVFGRETCIDLPDSALITNEGLRALAPNECLPDWSGDHRARLLSKPVFDPSSLGRVCLHNDNQGVVRGFLAARWLKRQLDANAPVAAIRNLLFGHAHGVPIVLPSLRQTAAWLAIARPDIAREIVRCDPALLMTAGDPASLDLAVRTEALRGLVARLAAGESRHNTLDRESLRRFATIDMVPALQLAWSQHEENDEVRRLLLNLVEAGALTDCSALAIDAVTEGRRDTTTRLYGMRALAATTTEADIRAFVQREQAEPGIDQTIQWEALDLFFPKYLSVEDFLAALIQNERRPEVARDFGWRGRTLIERISARADLERLLQGLLQEVGPITDNYDEAARNSAKAGRLAILIQAAASKLLVKTPSRQTNTFSIDAAIWLSRGHHYRNGKFEDSTFQQALIATIERRREGLWQAVDRLANDSRLARFGGLASLNQLAFLGWEPGLKPEDIKWLCEDGRQAPTQQRRQLAIDGMISLWTDAGKPDSVLADVRAIAALDEQSTTFLEVRLAPRELSADELAHKRDAARHERRQLAARQKADQSWIAFIDGLKADPAQLRVVPADLKPGDVDPRIYHIWRLLYETPPDRTEYAFDDFGEFEQVFGAVLADEARAALIRFWRGRVPVLTSSRKLSARNQINQFDSMSIAGVTLEAKADPKWANHLSAAEATTAAQLATLELNGFPSWIKTLCDIWPEQVRAVFVHEASDHIATDASQYGFIDKVKYADPQLAALCAPSIIKHVIDHPKIFGDELTKALEIIGRSLSVASMPVGFSNLALKRFLDAECGSQGALYLGIAFQTDPNGAIETLTRKLNGLDESAQKSLVENILPRVFGDRRFQSGIDPKILPFNVLERLVGIALRTIRPEEDNVHHGVFTPNQRDEAEDARGHLFNQLCKTPGKPTVNALKRLREDPACPIPAERITRMIFDREAEDAEHEPWPAGEARQMEVRFDIAPRSPRDLQQIALRRISEIDYDIHHADFAQGLTVKALPNEREVQKWTANELSHRKGRAYTLTREPHVVEEKEPDIRFQSNATDASLPIEIKVAESWSIAQLLAALTGQLAGRYLRERDKRHGILLLVHQKARPIGWPDATGVVQTFAQVVAILRAEAESMANSDQHAAHVEIAVINVSDI